MKNVYIVLDNDMEESVVYTNVYDTYEKAEKAVEEIIHELKEQYETIESNEDDWLFIDGDDTERVIEIRASLVK